MDAREEAQRLTSDAQRRHADDLSRLHADRAKVTAELKELSELLETERKRLTESLRAALSLVEVTLTASKEVSKLRPAQASFAAVGEDDIEDQIKEDAAAAAPSVRSPEEGDEGLDEGGQTNLSAVPPLEDEGPVTEAWHADSLTIFGPGNDFASGKEPESGPHYFGSLGSDWIAQPRRSSRWPGVRSAKAPLNERTSQPRRWTCATTPSPSDSSPSALNTSSAFEVCAPGPWKEAISISGAST